MAEAGQQHDGARDMERRRNEQERAERLKSLQGHRMTPRSPADFPRRELPEMRAMIEHANPGAIETSGRHWRSAADQLGGEDGHGGLRKAFQDAVAHASAHWEGSAAQAFRREAAKVLAKIDRSYQHARNVESTLIGSRTAGPEVGVAHNLREAQQAVVRLQLAAAAHTAEPPPADGGQLARDLANPKLDTRMALELNRATLPPGKQRQLEAAVVMDELAAHYDAQGTRLRDGTGHGLDGDWPVAPSDHPAPPPVNAAAVGHPEQHAPTAHRSHGGAVPAGFGSPRADGPVAIGLESAHGTALAAPHAGGHALIAGPPTGPVAPAPTSGGVPAPAFMPGVIGLATGGARPAGGPARGTGDAHHSASGPAGNPDAVAARAAAPLTPGVPRLPGAPGARPDGPTGGSRQGGAGLHRSRGGARATGDPAAAHGRGQHGPGEHPDKGGRGRPEERRRRYLDEDEATWTPPRELPPPVIE
ncbi:hypothetical protein [Streptomyces sp. WZ-12]|uniref:hypothetical protein n=1 Tax=Streptomyces sp. WZ-12 TaxID=3030210 RepID=UPI002380FBB5|nr:hypothetical protein [Streptomyces sp. WZ-12]